MILQQATLTDFESVLSFYDDVMERTPGIEHYARWRKGKHPTAEGIKAFILEGSLYLYKEQVVIVGALVVTMYQGKDYHAIEWSRDVADDEVAVIHLLAVSPDLQGRGIGEEMVREAIRLAQDHGMKSVRLDALASNTPAHRLYERMGFEYRGKQRLYAENTGWTDFFFFEYQPNSDSVGLFMRGYRYVTLRERPELKEAAAVWFHSKWNVPKEAYLECMEAYLNHETEYGWYLCLDGTRIIGGMGVIENDFHNRKDLSPNVCAVYTEEEYRCQGIAGYMLNKVVEDMRSKGISPLYLLTDHTGFYERYGWEFLCLVQGDGEPEMSRMYIHK